MRSPRITVLMPVYNGMPYLKEAIGSILQQTVQDIEILALDDASTDGSAEYLESIADPRLRVLRCEKQGHTALLNIGLRLAQTELVARMDSDDISLPHRLERQITLLDEESDVLACGCQVTPIDGNGTELTPWSNAIDHVDICFELAFGNCPIVHPSAMFRLRNVLAIGGYDINIKVAQDVDLWWRLSYSGRLANHPEVLFKYRFHDRNVSVFCADEQRRNVRAITARHLIDCGIAGSFEEAQIFEAFNGRNAELAKAVSGDEINVYCTVANRLADYLAILAGANQNQLAMLRRRVRWSLSEKARCMPRFSFTRNRLLKACATVDPENGRFGAMLVRAFRKSLPAALFSDKSGGQQLSTRGLGRR